MRPGKRLESLISHRSIGITNSHNAALWAIQSHYFSGIVGFLAVMAINGRLVVMYDFRPPDYVN